VEDAKALNKFIIVSGLKIHREQLDSSCAFFDPTSEEALAVIMQNCLQQPPQMVLKDYKKNIEQFGQDILEVFELN
jgi:hypothetical protein